MLINFSFLLTQILICTFCKVCESFEIFFDIYVIQVGLSLLGSAEDDITSSLIYATQVKDFNQTTTVPGDGPSIPIRKRRMEERELEAASQLGSDILRHGISQSAEIDNDGWQPSSKRNRNGDNYEKKKRDAESGKMTVRKHVKHTNRKMQLMVANSEKGRKSFEVMVTNTPSCTCRDFEINKSKSVCAHIIFAVCVVLGGSDLDESLKSRYLDDENLERIISQNIDTSHLQKKKPRRSRALIQDILRKDSKFYDEQVLTLMLKSGSREATCRTCRNVIRPGILCFKLTGALAVEYEKDCAVGRAFYFCSNEHCISAPKPVWTNIRNPVAYKVSSEVTSEQYEEFSEGCSLLRMD